MADQMISAFRRWRAKRRMIKIMRSVEIKMAMKAVKIDYEILWLPKK